MDTPTQKSKEKITVDFKFKVLQLHCKEGKRQVFLVELTTQIE
jgi:hypothetical protein